MCQKGAGQEWIQDVWIGGSNLLKADVGGMGGVDLVNLPNFS